jgi:Ca-activated chloride channel family protein
VGVQFGAELATKIGSVRGGNLYFIRDEPDVKQLFTGQLDYMVSELAHDLTLTITPRAGLKIAGVYGIPGELLGWQNDREIKVTIPTVFLDNHGGGIFFTLAPEAADSFLPEKSGSGALADVAVSYLPIGAARPDSHSISIAARDTVSDGMKLGALLIDEFTVLHEATSAHYLRNDQETAFQLVDGFKQRLDASPIGGLDEEKKLIDSMHERISFLSGHGSEAARTSPFAQLWGRWTITRINGGVDFERGETLEFTPDNNLVRSSDAGDEEYQSNNKQIYLRESELVFHYQIKGDTLTLHHRRTGVWVKLKRELG